MFNKRKADNIKYCMAKILKDPRNIKHIGFEAAETIFNTKDTREFTHKFAEIVYKNPELMKEINTMPFDVQQEVVRNLATWHGDLLPHFSKEALNDPDIATAALGPDHVLNMPMTEETVVVNRDGDTETRTVPDYSKLETWYELYHHLGDKAKEAILFTIPMPNMGKDEREYIAKHAPESIKDDVESLERILPRIPELYPHLPENIQEHPNVIIKMMDSLDNDYLKDVMPTLPRGVLKAIAEDYRIGWYRYSVPEELNYIYKDKELFKILLENNNFDERLFDSMEDKSILNDPEMFKYCMSKSKYVYGTKVDEFLDKLPNEGFKDAENMVYLLKAFPYGFKDSDKVRQLLNDMSEKEFEKVARVYPGVLAMETKRDGTKLAAELINEAKPEEIYSLYQKLGLADKLSKEDKLVAYLKNPKSMYELLKNEGREFFIEAVKEDPSIIDTIKDPQLRSDVFIAHTTVKYLNENLIKVSNEEELDLLIEKCKQAKAKLAEEKVKKTKKEEKKETKENSKKTSKK